MESKVRIDFERRREAIVQFYRGSIGLTIKKRRMDLQMTQESVGKGIISNTFVSKLENNVIHANKECLMLLMERLDLPLDLVELPEDMLAYLKRGLDCFYWNDWEAFQELFDEIRKFDFGVLIQIVRLGYHVLHKQTETATRIQNELYRYLTSMDNTAFSIFLLFSAANKINGYDYETANEYLTCIKEIMPFDSKLLALTRYYESLLFGLIKLPHLSDEAAEMAKMMFINAGNVRRLMLMSVDKYQFSVSEKSNWHIEYRQEHLPLLCPDEVDRYHVLRALSGEKPVFYLEKVQSDSLLYGLSRFLLCQYYKKNNDMDKYEMNKTFLHDCRHLHEESIDYYLLLVLREKADPTEYKDYLIDFLLPYAVKCKDIFVMELLTEDITKILISKKRYKDACSFMQK
ncbi:MAG: helix-turn-helix transcriptional regulator, partial [Candidatus Izemoplasmatales bacterium]